VKRFIVASQILVVTLFVIKILFLTDTVQGTSILSPLSMDQAIAETTTKAATATVALVKDITDDGLSKERDLFALLKERQKELDARESSLKAEEKKIDALKLEIMEKIDALKAMETKLASKLETVNEIDVKRLKELAKVYESSPPQKAAAMIDKLDVKTAAGITINMKRDRAGLIWGYLPPLKAVEITNEITKAVK